MGKILTRYDIQVKSEKEQMDLDFILNSNDKKVIHGTVWDDDLSNPKRVPEAIVQIFKGGKNYNENPLDIIPIGHVITDASGEFLAGPFEQDTIIVFKIFKFWSKEKQDNSNYYEASFQTSGEYLEFISGEEGNYRDSK